MKLAIAGLVGFDLAYPYIKRYFVDTAQDKSSDIQRVKVAPLEGLKQIFKDIKFDFYNINGVKWESIFFWNSYDDYWVDKVGYKITEEKFTQIIKTTHELHNMCLEATDLAINDDKILQKLFGIPPDMIPMIRESWKQRQADLLSRYDFLMGTQGELYFLEVNGDTPSGIIEAGPAQRKWAEFHKLLQFNTLEQNIAQGFQKIIQRQNKKQLVMFKNTNFEDQCTFEYLKSIVEPVLKVPIVVDDIENIETQMNGLENSQVYESSVFWRQYPLEWLASESPRKMFSDPRFYNVQSQTMIEPPWKIVMSNKAMSVLLQAMYPNNPHIIESYLSPLPENVIQLSKQKFAREGDAIEYSGGYEIFTQFVKDAYFKYFNPPIFQKYIPSDLHQNRYLTISSWVIQGQVSGVLLREDLNKIIGTGSSVVPYFIEKKGENDSSPIDIELNNTQSQSILRNQLYGQQFYDTNDILIKISERSQFIKDTKANTLEVKQNLNNQFAKAESVYNSMHSIEDSNLLESDIENKLNPALLGFAPLAAYYGAKQYQNKPTEEGNEARLPNTSGSGGGSSGSNYNNNNSSFGNGSSSSMNSNANHSSQKAGSIGRKYSSHS